MYFADPNDAGVQLAAALSAYRGRNPLVLAIPRGAVPLGLIVAESLGGELDVVLVRKLGAPDNPEFAIGAVAESGLHAIENYAAGTGADAAYLKHELGQQLAKIRERRAMLKDVPPIDAKGRLAIVVDDGLATGATMVAALRAVRDQAPAHLVCAVPVAAPDALRRVQPLADETVCLYAPAAFNAVGQFYRSFTQIEDAEVVDSLRRMRKLHAAKAAAPHAWVPHP